MAKTITIELHYSSREEQKALIDYLENQCWDYKVNPDTSKN